MELADLQSLVDARRREANRKLAENNLLIRQVDEMGDRVVNLAELSKVYEGGRQFLEDLASKRRGALKGKIEGIVTDALRVLYGDSYRVELTYSTKANRSCLDVEMVRATPQGEVRREIGGFGGGVADTISVPLRLMVLVGSRKTDKVVVLDECWKHVDPARVEAVGQFLQTIVKQLGLQVIMCTHHDGLKSYADRIFEVSEKEGTSQVEAVSM